MNKIVLSLACILLAVVYVSAQPTNQNLDLWVRYQDRIYNFWRSHGYTQARNQKQVWRLPNTFRINRSVNTTEDADLPVESTIPTCYYTGSTIICGRTSSGFNDTVECAVAKRFEDSLLEQLEIYALSERRDVLLPSGQNVTKFYLYARYDPQTVLGSLLVQRYGARDAKRPVVSLHSVDSIQDNGFTVIDSVCWGQLIDFLSVGEQDSVLLQGSGEERPVSGALIFL
jgi:hypothetical protein